ncbi:MAG: SufD family Fe-S cluster assembly protein, partial [Chthoniobacterales bacterium]
KTDAYQKVRNVVLSDDAEANSMPGLEIEADDVRFTHGATTAQIDDREIFYLEARGIRRKPPVSCSSWASSTPSSTVCRMKNSAATSKAWSRSASLPPSAPKQQVSHANSCGGALKDDTSTFCQK